MCPYWVSLAEKKRPATHSSFAAVLRTDVLRVRKAWRAGCPKLGRSKECALPHWAPLGAWPGPAHVVHCTGSAAGAAFWSGRAGPGRLSGRPSRHLLDCLPATAWATCCVTTRPEHMSGAAAWPTRHLATWPRADRPALSGHSLNWLRCGAEPGFEPLLACPSVGLPAGRMFANAAPRCCALPISLPTFWTTNDLICGRTDIS